MTPEEFAAGGGESRGSISPRTTEDYQFTMLRDELKPEAQLLATSPRSIVAMTLFKGRLIVATSEGVFERLDDGKFHEILFAAR